MDQPSFYTNILINSLIFSYALVDTACGCFGTLSLRFANKARLPRIRLDEPRALDGIVGDTGCQITELAYADIDIDGHQQRRFLFYVIPEQNDDVILGLPWMEQESVSIDTKKGLMYIGSSQLTVRRRYPDQETKAPHAQVMATTFVALAKRAAERCPQQEAHRTRIFAASLADIEKALRPKRHSDPRLTLPKCYSDFLPLFDREASDKLPPHRPGIDHSIPLRKNDKGETPEVPWGPLYGMSREELLVLRKTLTELLDKRFIRVSQSAAAAPVLFVKKPGGGLRFCVDYRALNAITEKDRYPLPLIRETLRSLTKAKWFTKLDVIAAFHKIRVKEGEEWKTAFRTRYGSFEWLVTPFGLSGSPATFQRYINKTLEGMLDEFASAYMDDVLVYTNGSLEDHKDKVRQVLFFFFFFF